MVQVQSNGVAAWMVSSARSKSTRMMLNILYG